MAEPIVHVIDDAADIRQSLAVLLDVHGYGCRTYVSALEFLGLVRPDWTGCIVADVRMPGMDGIEMLKELAARGIDVPVIVVTAHADVPMAVAALKAGAFDFIEKPFRDEILMGAIRKAFALPVGERSRDGAGLPQESLSEREREVLALIVAGHPNKIVADRLGISVRTVEVHRAHIMEKTGARNLADLIRRSLFRGTK